MSEHLSTEQMYEVRVSGRFGSVKVTREQALKKFVEPCGGTSDSFEYGLRKFGKWHGSIAGTRVDVEIAK